MILPLAPLLLQPEARPPGRYSETVTVGKFKRSYLLYVPSAARRPAPRPIVVALHGVTGNAAAMAASIEIGKYAEREGFIAIVPNGSGGLSGWNAGWIDLSGQGMDDVAFVGKMLDKVEGEFRTDPNRVFALGHSNGAFLANLVAAKLSRRIAAIASVAGTIGGNVDGKTQTIPAPAEPVSVLLIHGKLDPVVSYDGSGRAMLTGVSAPRSAKWWAERDGCRGMKETKLPNGAGTRLTYTGGAGGTEVELISTDRGTHDFPAALQRGNVRERESGVAGMEEIVRFFARHPKGR